ncbi:MAG: hypothetical protein ACHQQQ_07100 [Bacteroidota bacterium]
MNNITILSHHRHCSIEISHNDSTPGRWLVCQYSTVLGVRKCVSSNDFTNERQALLFANGMKQDYDGYRRAGDIK